MSQLAAYTNTFVAGTKAKASEVNTNFTEIKTAHNATDTELPAYTNGSRLIASNSGKTAMEEITATTTEANYLSGVTSAIQDQIDAKSASTDVVLLDGSQNPTGIIEYDSDLSGSMTTGSNEIPSIKWVEDNVVSGIDFARNLIWKHDSDADHDINFYSPNTLYTSQVLMRDASYSLSTRSKAGTTEITKKIDATWASGDDEGGLDDNDSLSTDLVLYGFRLGKASDTTAIDYIFSDDITGVSALTDAAVVAAGYDLISASPVAVLPPLDASSNILKHYVAEIMGGGADIVFDVPILDYNATQPGISATTPTLSVPANTSANIIYSIYSEAETVYGLLTTTQQTDTTPSSSVFNIITTGYSTAGSIDTNIKTDASRQIRQRISIEHHTTKVSVITKGYTISRRP